LIDTKGKQVAFGLATKILQGTDPEKAMIDMVGSSTEELNRQFMDWVRRFEG